MSTVRFDGEEREWGQDGDKGFSGVDGSRDPRLLEQALVAEAKNIDFAEGIARTRDGIMGLPWGRGAGIDFPWRFLARWPRVADGSETDYDGIDFDAPCGLGTVKGIGIYSDPYGAEAVLLAAGDRVWRLRAGSAPAPIALNVELPDACRLVQAFEKVIMLGGDGFDPQVWDPLQTFDGGQGAFVDISRIASDNPYATPLPQGHYAVEIGGRLWVAYGRDRLAVSEVYDYTNYDPIWGTFRLNEGSDDQVVAIAPYRNASLAVMFDQSVWMIDNAEGDLGNLKASIVTDRFGCVGPDAWIRVGADLWMLAADGVRRVSMGEDGSARAEEGTVSEPVAHILDRVNWSAASAAKLSAYGRRVYVAVPLDGSLVADALLVYDLDRKAWQGYWTSTGGDFSHLIVAEHGGRRRQMCADSRGILCVVGEGTADNVLGADVQIACSLQTRMYAGRGGEQLVGAVVDVDLQTWGQPTHRIEVIGDGPSETSQPSGDVTPIRTRYAGWSRQSDTYDVTNMAGGHADAGREDYSVPSPATDAADGTGTYFDSTWPEALAVASFSTYAPTLLIIRGFDPALILAIEEWEAPGVLKPAQRWSVMGWGWENDELNGVELMVESVAYNQNTPASSYLSVYAPAVFTAPGANTTWQSRTGPVYLCAPWMGAGCRLDLQARSQRRFRIRRAGAGIQVRIEADGGRIGLQGVGVAAMPGRRDYRARH